MKGTGFGVTILGVALTASAGSAIGATAVAVPLRLVEHFPVVMVRIDGIEVPLVFDSGDSSTAVFQRSVLDLIHAAPIGESSRMSDAKGHLLRSPEFLVPKIQIGGAVFRDVVGRLDVHHPAYPATDVGQKGFLGTGLFKAHEVVVDYRHRTLSLIPRAAADPRSPACHGTVVPFAPIPPLNQPGEPVVVADTDLGPVTLWWDTGAPQSILSERFIQQSHALVSEGEVKTTRFRLEGADFGPWRFKIMAVSLPPFFSGFVGYDFFARHVVCMDFPHNQLVIRPNA